jgi:hypothetical protein
MAFAGEIYAVRCPDCHAEYRFDTDLLTGRDVWVRPKVKRAKGSCHHTVGQEVMVEHPDGGARWITLEAAADG